MVKRMWLLSEDADWESIAWIVRGELVNHEEVSGDVWTELRIVRDGDRLPLSAVEGDIVVIHSPHEVEIYVRKDPPVYTKWLAEEMLLSEEDSRE